MKTKVQNYTVNRDATSSLVFWGEIHAQMLTYILNVFLRELQGLDLIWCQNFRWTLSLSGITWFVKWNIKKFIMVVANLRACQKYHQKTDQQRAVFDNASPISGLRYSSCPKDQCRSKYPRDLAETETLEAWIIVNDQSKKWRLLGVEPSKSTPKLMIGRYFATLNTKIRIQ